VTFDIDQDEALAGVVGQGTGESSKESTLNGAQIEETASGKLVETQANDIGVGFEVGSIGVMNRPKGGMMSESLVPVELRGEKGVATSEFVEARCPGEPGGRLWRQNDRVAGAGKLAGELQVFEENTPGDAVDDEVMSDNQETLAGGTEIESDSTDQGSAVENERGLELSGEALEFLNGVKLDPLEGWFRIGVNLPGMPEVILESETLA
jgi:hypothetical protein